MGFPDDMNLDDNEATHEVTSLFPPSERPTMNERNRKTERLIRDSPEFVIGRMMAEIVKLRHEANRLNRGTNFGLGPFQAQRTSIRPQVQTATVSATVTAILMAIYQLLHQSNIIK
jgi:hypothetical protein